MRAGVVVGLVADMVGEERVVARRRKKVGAASTQMLEVRNEQNGKAGPRSPQETPLSSGPLPWMRSLHPA
jgi:hypothetical protein